MGQPADSLPMVVDVVAGSQDGQISYLEAAVDGMVAEWSCPLAIGPNWVPDFWLSWVLPLLFIGVAQLWAYWQWWT